MRRVGNLVGNRIELVLAIVHVVVVASKRSAPLIQL